MELGGKEVRKDQKTKGESKNKRGREERRLLSDPGHRE